MEEIKPAEDQFNQTSTSIRTIDLRTRTHHHTTLADLDRHLAYRFAGEVYLTN